jgi:hypothetical protein
MKTSISIISLMGMYFIIRANLTFIQKDICVIGAWIALIIAIIITLISVVNIIVNFKKSIKKWLLNLRDTD